MGCCTSGIDVNATFESASSYALIEDVYEDRSLVFVHVSSSHNRTYLHLACQHDRFSLVRTLLKLGADALARDDTELLPLHLAVQNNSLKALRTLIADVYRKNPARIRLMLNARAHDGRSAVGMCTHDPEMARKKSMAARELRKAAGLSPLASPGMQSQLSVGDLISAAGSPLGPTSPVPVAGVGEKTLRRVNSSAKYFGPVMDTPKSEGPVQPIMLSPPVAPGAGAGGWDSKEISGLQSEVTGPWGARNVGLPDFSDEAKHRMSKANVSISLAIPEADIDDDAILLFAGSAALHTPRSHPTVKDGTDGALALPGAVASPNAPGGLTMKNEQPSVGATKADNHSPKESTTPPQDAPIVPFITSASHDSAVIDPNDAAEAPRKKKKRTSVVDVRGDAETPGSPKRANSDAVPAHTRKKSSTLSAQAEHRVLRSEKGEEVLQAQPLRKAGVGHTEVDDPPDKYPRHHNPVIVYGYIHALCDFVDCSRFGQMDYHELVTIVSTGKNIEELFHYAFTIVNFFDSPHLTKLNVEIACGMAPPNAKQLILASLHNRQSTTSPPASMASSQRHTGTDAATVADATSGASLASAPNYALLGASLRTATESKSSIEHGASSSLFDATDLNAQGRAQSGRRNRVNSEREKRTGELGTAVQVLFTPMHAAVHSGRTDVVRRLVVLGGRQQLLVPDNRGNTILHLAVGRFALTGDDKMLKFLVGYVAEVESMVFRTNNNGWRPGQYCPGELGIPEDADPFDVSASATVSPAHVTPRRHESLVSNHNNDSLASAPVAGDVDEPSTDHTAPPPRTINDSIKSRHPPFSASVGAVPEQPSMVSCSGSGKTAEGVSDPKASRSGSGSGSVVHGQAQAETDAEGEDGGRGVGGSASPLSASDASKDGLKRWSSGAAQPPRQSGIKLLPCLRHHALADYFKAE